MYTFSFRLKIFSFILMLIGIIALIQGFSSVPSSVEEMRTILEHSEDHGAHAKHGETSLNSHHDLEHEEHTLHQLQNKPWAALYYALFFFTAIGLVAMFFYAVQHAAQAGWPIVLLRVMEGVSWFLPVGGFLIILILILSGAHMNHLFHWMAEGITDPNSQNYDSIIAGKKGFLNVPFFIGRAILFWAGWTGFFLWMRKLNIQMEENEGNNFQLSKKLRNVSAGFIVFFAVTSSIMAWDWIMSLEPHWFSTLFGWYIFSMGLVSAVSAITLVTIYLKSKGYLEIVNDSHIHDLGKYMFAFSIFWTYLWFSQFMLYWYANIPEEVTYFIARFQEYRGLYLTMLVLNFIAPVLILMNSEFKRHSFFIILTALCIIIGHSIETYCLVMPGTVGKNASVGFVEIGSWVGMLGLFIFVVFAALTKLPLVVKQNPYLKESEQYHY